ncbi:MAG: 4-hydroxy-tetrahydrodipicolinate reductase [Flavobacterium sp.]|jgi:4-hydroxy-tetrahydrodipicolinate reductase
MKIAILGYGKMGKVIEKNALSRGHEIVLRKSAADGFDGLLQADVAIDFSIPDAAVANISECLNNGIPVISGTTGWLENYHEMVSLCEENKAAFIYGSNFSLGVNLFFELNERLSQLMSNYPDYKVAMEEIHHTQKLDKPSGTSITLANSVINNIKYNDWNIEKEAQDSLYIDVKRIENVPGTHLVSYNSEVDSIEIKHTAHNREGFALGAIIAAEWLVGKTGVFTMKDVLGLN